MKLTNTIIINFSVKEAEVCTIINEKYSKSLIKGEYGDEIIHKIMDIIRGNNIKIVIISANFNNSVPYTEHLKGSIERENYYIQNKLISENKRLRVRKDDIRVVETLEILIRDEE